MHQNWMHNVHCIKIKIKVTEKSTKNGHIYFLNTFSGRIHISLKASDKSMLQLTRYSWNNANIYRVVIKHCLSDDVIQRNNVPLGKGLFYGMGSKMKLRRMNPTLKVRVTVTKFQMATPNLFHCKMI